MEALKSGKYTQGFGELKSIDELGREKHCCIGVLGCIIEDLNNDCNSLVDSPYQFLKNNVGKSIIEDLYLRNDRDEFKKAYKGKYKNVIPLIESLPVKE